MELSFDFLSHQTLQLENRRLIGIKLILVIESINGYGRTYTFPGFIVPPLNSIRRALEQPPLSKNFFVIKF